MLAPLILLSYWYQIDCKRSCKLKLTEYWSFCLTIVLVYRTEINDYCTTKWTYIKPLILSAPGLRSCLISKHALLPSISRMMIGKWLQGMEYCPPHMLYSLSSNLNPTDRGLNVVHGTCTLTFQQAFNTTIEFEFLAKQGHNISLLIGSRVPQSALGSDDIRRLGCNTNLCKKKYPGSVPG